MTLFSETQDHESTGVFQRQKATALAEVEASWTVPDR